MLFVTRVGTPSPNSPAVVEPCITSEIARRTTQGLNHAFTWRNPPLPRVRRVPAAVESPTPYWDSGRGPPGLCGSEKRSGCPFDGDARIGVRPRLFDIEKLVVAAVQGATIAVELTFPRRRVLLRPARRGRDARAPVLLTATPPAPALRPRPARLPTGWGGRSG